MFGLQDSTQRLPPAGGSLIPPERLIRARCVVGIVPFGREGLERDAWLAGIAPYPMVPAGYGTYGCASVLTPDAPLDAAGVGHFARAHLSMNSVLCLA